MTKCNDFQAHVKKVIYWILNGHSMLDINEAMEQEWPDNKELHKAIMNHVLLFFTKSGEANPDIVRGWCLESLRELYRKMVDIGDFANAAKVIKDIYNLNNK